MILSDNLPKACRIGAWLSPARALGSGPRGREFESPRPDKEKGDPLVGSPFLFKDSMFWVYILRSEKTNKYYTGSTQNVSERLMEHNAGKSKSTRGGIPWHLVYFREYGSRVEAVRAEKQIKGRGAERFLNTLIL